MAQSKIHIKKSNQGKLRKRHKVKKGQKIPVAKLQKDTHSKNKITRARAQFALNARSWKH